ncbi:Uncharacterized protein HII31_02039 [Pseudocercospora fuligena]|uniref:Methyltransferase domain-containing protein n=1 Tax=Pseudocercospora fuligena TaxID=685502 RepID=A0A8H6RT06_9PEZI|nr:Uncharacterized protein HII31_02039 [Pseudocercospora fuligena]
MHTESIARAFDADAFLCTTEELCSRRRKTPGTYAGFDLCQFDGIAQQYVSPKDLPHGKMEKALVSKALGNCAGLRILDIAGGTGDHARIAIGSGADRVDVVDISEAMMEIGKKIEAEAGREVIHWYRGDIVLPLWEQIKELPIQGYDIIIGAFPFDHIETVEELVFSWRNIAAYLKPGGRIVCARVGNPWSRCVQDGKYGARATLIEQTPTRAVRCQVVVNTKPPFTFYSCSTEVSLRGDTYIPNKLGIINVHDLDPKETELYQEDPEFWKDFIEDPYFVVFTARKISVSSK